MINTIVDIEEIQYTEKPVPDNLLESIRIRGVAIPVRVRKTETGYECLDGHQRLSALNQLMQEDERFRRVPVMLVNDFTKAGSGFWGNTRNKH
ncbi:MAG: ParB-like nuclease domain-containing protein [Solobacterium sp.]|nr:ParB-like nuclease domain-containing protein [Solobacterium sp.]